MTGSPSPNAGASFGYRNLVVDMRALPMMRRFAPVVFDVTHSLQLPGGLGHATGGAREFHPFLSRAAAAVGVDGSLRRGPLRTRPKALSDATTQLDPTEFERLVAQVTAIANTLTRGGRMSLDPGPAGPREPKPTPSANLMDQLDGDFEDAVDLVVSCAGRVVCTGMGKSGIICRKLAATMSSTGTPSLFLHPAEAIHGDLGMVTESDLVVAISNSGRDGGDPPTLEILRRQGIKLIAMTFLSRFTLAKAADIHLDLGVSKGGVSAQPRSDRLDDRQPRPRGRSGSGGLGAKGVPGRGFCTLPSGWQAGQEVPQGQ